MSIEAVKEIMAEAGSGYLATTDGEKASVRPMGCPQWVEGELWFATGINSAKVAEIRRKSRVEFCIADKAWRFVRIAGACIVSTAMDDRQAFWDRVPVVKDYFKGVDDPNYAVLRVKVDSIRLMTEDGETIVELPAE